jgi:hypothetical protein
MLLSSKSFTSRRGRLLAALAFLCSSPLLALPARNALPKPAFPAPALREDDQHVGDAIGVIEGDAIAVTGPMSVEVVRGQVKTLLRSGADIHVKSGSARIALVEGGQITICGPAHLSLLKSGGAVTVALDTGTIHVYIEREPAVTIYTAQIKAQPLSIGDSPQDTLVGLDSAGAMCIRATRGAVRIEQQLTGQSMIIPQAGDVQLTNGQLDSLRGGSGRCACELQLAKLAPPPPAASTPTEEVSRLATAEEVHRDLRDTKPNLPASRDEKPVPPAVKDAPIYQVFVPPLIYDAKAAVQPDIDPKMIVLVRRVRVRPTLIFQGRVEGQIVAAAMPVPAAPLPAPGPAAQPAAKKATPAANDSLVDRVRTFVRRLWSRNS